MSESKFDFNKFIADSKETLLNPKGFFESMSTTGGMVEPLVKALIYGGIAAVINLLWGLFFGNAITGGLFGGAIGIMAFIGTIFGALIGLFLGAVIILLLSAICSGNTDFEANLRVSASLMVLMPINAFLNVFGLIGGLLGTLISIALGAYGLYLLFVALTKSLGAKVETAKVILYVLLALLLITQIFGYLGKRAMRKSFREISKYEEMYSEQESDDDSNYESYSDDEDYNNEDADDSDYYSNEKPAEFPSKALDLVKENLSDGENMITQEKIDNLIELTKKMNNAQSDSDKLMELLQEYNYSNIADYTNDFTVVMAGITAVSSLNAIEKMLINGSKEEKKAAELYTVDEMLKSAASQSIKAGKLTKADLMLVYDNWEKISNLEKEASVE